MNAEDKARTIAHCTSGSSSLHSTAPTLEPRISPAAFALSAKMRTGSHSIPHLKCICKQEFTTLAHILSCKKMRGKFVRHDVVVDTLTNMCRRAGLVARKEVMHVPDSQKRMDIVIYKENRAIWIDVSVVNPLAPSYINNKNPLKTREDHKRTKWQIHAESQDAVFFPFVINAFGGMGDSAKTALKMIAEEAALRNPYPLPKDIMIWMAEHTAKAKQRIAAALAFAVQQSCQEAYIRATGSNIPDNHYAGKKRVSEVPTYF
jgi:hypothetical protein